jgi:hypothetical protein
VDRLTWKRVMLLMKYWSNNPPTHITSAALAGVYRKERPTHGGSEPVSTLMSMPGVSIKRKNNG